ncbi:MAG TPA: cobalamin-binding protein [Firmicutes bacterium]|nr:cobalamin-binding protein [Candidatus Fermentithermobacillaceae bacterium]
MNRRRLSRLAVVALLMIFAISSLAGCTKTGGSDAGVNAKDGYPMEVVDSTGRTVTIEAMPERIVSLAPSNTEMLYACGLESKVVGVTTFCNYPEEVKDKEKVGGFSDPSIEKIVALEPDLVLATTIHHKFLDEMENLGLTVLVMNAGSVKEVMDEIQLLGKVSGNVDETKDVVSNMQGKVDQVKQALKDVSDDEKVKVFYMLWDEPIMTIGPNTLLNDVITLAGGVSVSGDAGTDYPTYSLETLVDKDPEAIIFTVMGTGGGIDPERVKAQDGWNAISAIKNDRIYGIDDDLMSRPGPRIVDGLLEVARALYPDRFPDTD